MKTCRQIIDWLISALEDHRIIDVDENDQLIGRCIFRGTLISDITLDDLKKLT